MANEAKTPGSVVNPYVGKYIKYQANGSPDMKATMAALEADVRALAKLHEALKPVIEAQLETFKRLGEDNLIIYVLASVKLAPTSDNREQVKLVLAEMAANQKIVFKTTESGGRRGRGVGWTLAAPSAPAT